MSEHANNQAGQEQTIHEEIIDKLHLIDERLEELEEVLFDYATLLEEDDLEEDEGEECQECDVEDDENDDDEYEEEGEEGLELGEESEEYEEYSEDPHEEMLNLLENIEARLDVIETIVEEHLAIDLDEFECEEGVECQEECKE